MNVIFYQLTKKHNSTLQPSGSGTTISCDIKDECSIMNPSLTLNLGTENAPSYNYCYISAFGRYYFVDDWSYFQGLWTCGLSIDVLATYKSTIGSASLYVLRSASQSNPYLIDTTYPIAYQSSDAVAVASSEEDYFKCIGSGVVSSASKYVPWSKSFEQGSVIVGVTEENYNGVTFYSFKASSFKTFFKWLINSFPTEEESWLLDIGSALKKAFYKPLQYVTTCYWIPVTELPGITYNDSKEVYIGETHSEFSNVSDELDFTTTGPEWYLRFDLPEHPLASTRGYWLDNEPYTDMCLDILPFGTIPLPMSKLAGATSIVARIMLDIPTGNAELYIYTGVYGNRDTLIYHTSGKWGVDLPLAQNRVTTSGMGAAIATTASSAIGAGLSTAMYIDSLDVDAALHMKGGPRGANLKAAHAIRQQKDNKWGEVAHEAKNATIEQIPTAIGSLVGGIQRVSSSSGAPGSAIAFTQRSVPSLYAQFYTPADEDLAHRGRPLCKIKTINTLSGFIKCNDGDVDLTCTQDEKELVRIYLTNGFFYE